MDGMNILDIIKFWFDKKNSDLWFNATEKEDKEITDRFKRYLSLELSDDQLTLNPKLFSEYEYLGHVILYDQLVRHFFRNDKEMINKYHKKVVILAKSMLNNNFDKIYKPEERCFLLLPLRHTFNLEELEFVIVKIKEYMSEYDPNDIPIIYNRFFRATLISHSSVKTALINVEPINETITNDAIFNVLDKGKQNSNVDTSAVPNLFEIEKLNHKNEFYRHFDDTLSQFGHDNYEGIIVSLSGGVDSMVCSFVLHHYLQRKKKKLIAVHVNYGNRETCHLEVELVKRWCKLLGIELYIRHIEHLRRSRDKNRETYEEVTRIMRFHLYKRFGFPVVLGHNKDDTIENMLTNISKSKCFDNLRGMKNIGQEDDVIILRPMLEIAKSDIYEFARIHKIPHLEDSTPEWSARGRMRDDLIPYLNKFDTSFIPGLFNLAETMLRMTNIYKNSVLENFKKNNIKEIDGVLIVIANEELNYGYQFWKDIIYNITNSRNLEPPSHKSILSMCERFESKNYGKISMTLKFTVDFNDKNIRLLF